MPIKIFFLKLIWISMFFKKNLLPNENHFVNFKSER